MAAAEHRFEPKPRRIRGKVRGGRAVGCSCGAMTLVADVRNGIAWHASHRVEEAKPAAVLERVRVELDTIEAELARL